MGNRYILFFKPYDVLSTFTDPQGRQTLGSYVTAPGVYAAGRLDQDSEGLMLLTDDGRLAHLLTDPQHKLPKTYFVQVENEPDREALAKLRRGVMVKGEMTLPAEVELFESEPDLPPRAVPIRYRPSIPTRWLRMVLREGRKRQIRHMTAAVGHPTLRLVRVAIGPLTLRGLTPGEWRDLTPEELAALRQALSWLGSGAGAAAAAKGAPGEKRGRGPKEESRQPRARPDSERASHTRSDRQGRPERRTPGARSEGRRDGHPERPPRRTGRDAGEDASRRPSGAGRGPQPPQDGERDAPKRRPRPAGRQEPRQKPRPAPGERSDRKAQRSEKPPVEPRTEPKRPSGQPGEVSRRPSRTHGSRGVGQRPKRPPRRDGGEGKDG